MRNELIGNLTALAIVVLGPLIVAFVWLLVAGATW